MNINKSTWLRFTCFALLSIFIWFKFSYPQNDFIDTSVTRSEALKAARQYLTTLNVNTDQFKTAILFNAESSTSRYLQKTLGFDGLKKFLKDNNYELFFWSIRFYKENEKEEYQIFISSKTAEVLSFQHTIDANAARPEISKEDARKNIRDFLITQYQFDPSEYILKNNVESKLDNRIEYAVTWQKKDVKIPWDTDTKKGTAKLLTGASISGNEILSFSKSSFSIPEQFERFLSRQENLGNNLSVFLRAIVLALFASSVFFVIVRRNHMVMHTTKMFYITLMFVFVGLSILGYFNSFQSVIYDYPTTNPISSYLFRSMVNTFMSSIFITVTILFPALSGEALRFEIFRNKTRGGLLENLKSSFFTKDVSQMIILGYFVWILMIGIQSLLIKIGQQYWGVWTQHSLISQSSSAYFPFLSALMIGIKASLSEEIFYRMFAICWIKKMLDKFNILTHQSTFIAAIIASLIWGFTHSNYPVYPMWFRAIEVSCLGFLLSFVYLRYGLIVCFVAHYLFNVFWHSTGYLLGTSTPFNFFSAIVVLLLPAIFAIISFRRNNQENSKELQWKLTAPQQNNLKVLSYYLMNNKSEYITKANKDIEKEFSSSGWDIAVIELAISKMREALEKE